MVFLTLFAYLLPFSLSDVPVLEKENKNGQMIYFIRHGESCSNIPDPTTGIMHTSGRGLQVPLTEKGKQQAAELGHKLSAKIPQDSEIVILSSPALRAQETAFEIFTILKEKGIICELDPIMEEDFCEMGQGDWEGKPKDHIYKAELSKWEQLSPYEKISAPMVSGGETFFNVGMRALKATQRVIDRHPRSKFLFIVSHHTALNALAFHLNNTQEALSNLPYERLPHIHLRNCDLISIQIPESGLVKEAKAVAHFSCE